MQQNSDGFATTSSHRKGNLHDACGILPINVQGQVVPTPVKAEDLAESLLAKVGTACPPEPDGFERYCFDALGIHLDLSGMQINGEILDLLLRYAGALGVPDRLGAQFTCAPINPTEQRMACHPLLRTSSEEGLAPDVAEVVSTVRRERDRFCSFAGQVRDGRIESSASRRFTDIVHLGTGGSHWPVRLLYEAFEREAQVRCHFVATVDPTALELALRGLEPESTLVVVATKSFGTRETLENAEAARRWLEAAVPGRSGMHLAAATARSKAAVEFGIPPDRVFALEEWVGGRYSVWSASSLSAVVALGAELFEEFLAGAEAMDRHVLSTPASGNLAVLTAVARIWLHRFMGHQSRCVLAYGYPIRSFVSYSQQLLMESCGKASAFKEASGCEIIWGGEGPVSEHAFHQFLLQGGVQVPVEMLVCARPWGREPEHRDRSLLAHCLGQGMALGGELSTSQVRNVLEQAGLDSGEADRQAGLMTADARHPLVTVLLEELSPRILGAFLALQEHAVVAQAAMMNVNPFDQWGVEFGKESNRRFRNLLESGGGQGKSLADRVRRMLDEPG